MRKKAFAHACMNRLSLKYENEFKNIKIKREVNMNRKFWILGICILVLSGCSALVQHKVNYDISLDSVERPAEAQERYGDQKIFEADQEKYQYTFEDEMIKVLWLPTTQQFFFMLENKTDYSIRIIWDEAALVDPKGQTHKVIHSGVKYIDRNNPQAPSVVVRKGKITDIVVPSDLIYYGESSSTFQQMMGVSKTGWHIKDIIPRVQEGGDPQNLLNIARQYIGQSIQILLPIQIEDIIIDYIFIFKIKDTELATKK